MNMSTEWPGLNLQPHRTEIPTLLLLLLLLLLRLMEWYYYKQDK